MSHPLSRLARWLNRELSERNLSAREAALRAGLNHGAVSRYLAGHRPSIDSARKLAAFFQVPDVFVLELAGQVEPTPEHDEFTTEVARLSANWSAEQRELALNLMRAMERQRRNGAARPE